MGAPAAPGEVGHRLQQVDGHHPQPVQVGPRPAGIPDVPAAATRLMAADLTVDLCGSCLRYRGLGGTWAATLHLEDWDPEPE